MSIAEMFSVQRFLIAAFVVFQNAIFCKSMNDFFFYFRKSMSGSLASPMH